MIPSSIEGAVSSKALMYVPGNAPYDFYIKDCTGGLQLYSSGMMILENCEDPLLFWSKTRASWFLYGLMMCWRQ